jgi:hypothetical protein
MATKTEIRKEIEQLRNVASQMSHVCFNLSQNEKFEPREREIMRGLYKNYDAIKRCERRLQ